LILTVKAKAHSTIAGRYEDCGPLHFTITKSKLHDQVTR